MKQLEHLLHPELIDSMPVGARVTAHLINKRAHETLVDEPANDPNLSVVIRTRNVAARLEQLFEDIHHQVYSSEVEVIVVDSESTDRTPRVASYYGAEVVTLPRGEFTYPKSMNSGVEAASHDTVFVTVGHALLSNVYNLHAGARHFNHDTVAGAFGTVLPNDNASYIEKLAALGNVLASRPAHKIKEVTMGVLAATGAMIAKPAWQELGRFDERYEAGGDDTALAGLMLKNGYDVLREAALTVHHSHGLGMVDYIKQDRAWNKSLKGPQPYDEQELLARRPDLRGNGIQ
jgi:glycosyltransferase involved in cell wall biosynthesis